MSSHITKQYRCPFCNARQELSLNELPIIKTFQLVYCVNNKLNNNKSCGSFFMIEYKVDIDLIVNRPSDKLDNNKREV